MSTVRTSDFGTGALSRASALVHTVLTVEALLLLTASPGVAGLLLIGPDPPTSPSRPCACCPSDRPCPPRSTPSTTAAATSPNCTRPAPTCAAGGSTPCRR